MPCSSPIAEASVASPSGRLPLILEAMGEPARTTLLWDEPDEGLAEGEPFVTILQRWVERPDGRMELVELPLTPELFLDPQLEDIMVQGRPHSLVRRYFADLLERHLRFDVAVMVLEDVKHLLGPGLPGPAPDVSVIRGARHPDPDLSSYDVVEQGVAPCLVVEVVSPKDARIRRTDEVDKVDLYQRVGITEYLLVDMPRRATGHRFRLKGLRLGRERRYQPIEPDAQGYILSETTSLRFGVSARGDQVDLFDALTGERLLSALEEEEGRKAAEERASRAEAGRQLEVAARRAAEEKASRAESAQRAAEDEMQRLRAEIEQLKKL